MAEPAAMPDPMAKWSPSPDWTRAQIVRAHWRARPVLGLSQTLLGGRLAAAIATLAPGAPSVGLWRIAPDLPIAIRIGRDKALLVAEDGANARTGWRSEGWASSDASDAYLVLEISGQATPELVREATTADLDENSPSAAILFAGVPALLYRCAADIARLHVEQGLAAYVWRWLETRGN